jgi:hypothetical protein
VRSKQVEEVEGRKLVMMVMVKERKRRRGGGGYDYV